eukprot:11223208-Lingulodinium_polyedra.AAC.1
MSRSIDPSDQRAIMTSIAYTQTYDINIDVCTDASVERSSNQTRHPSINRSVGAPDKQPARGERSFIFARPLTS